MLNELGTTDARTEMLTLNIIAGAGEKGISFPALLDIVGECRHIFVMAELVNAALEGKLFISATENGELKFTKPSEKDKQLYLKAVNQGVCVEP